MVLPGLTDAHIHLRLFANYLQSVDLFGTDKTAGLAKIAAHLGLPARADYWRERADIIHGTILEKAWNEDIGAFTAAFGGEDLDASVLLMAEIGFIAADDPRYVSTVQVINRDLREGDHVYRYKVTDDFGKPKTA